MKKILIVPFLLFFFSLSAQDSIPLLDRVADFPTRFLDKLRQKSNRVEGRLISYSNKALHRLEKKERRLNKRLARKDSALATEVFGDIDQRYEKLQQQLNQTTGKLKKSNEYFPYVDSISTSLDFLSNHSQSLLRGKRKFIDQLKGANSGFSKVQDKFKTAADIGKIIHARQAYLKEKLGSFGFAKQLRNLNKEAYYYAARVKDYRNELLDPAKIERRALQYLNKLPLFQKFMKENSQLSSLFRLPANYGNIQSLQGLQTRAEVMNIINRGMQNGGNGAQAMMQQGMQQARSQLQQFKNKLKDFGGQGQGGQMPDFKANPEKTKSLWKRIEFGSNIQTAKSNWLLPSTTDIGITIGVKLNAKSIVGVRGAYKMGWGKDINHIRLSHQGIGFGSFIDWKLKGKFYVSGGYEQNYRSEFRHIDQLKDFNAWQHSALLGLMKKYKLSKKWKGNIQLLYDFLYRRQGPGTRPLVLRMGYNF